MMSTQSVRIIFISVIGLVVLVAAIVSITLYVNGGNVNVETYSKLLNEFKKEDKNTLFKEMDENEDNILAFFRCQKVNDSETKLLFTVVNKVCPEGYDKTFKSYKELYLYKNDKHTYENGKIPSDAYEKPNSSYVYDMEVSSDKWDATFLEQISLGFFGRCSAGFRGGFYKKTVSFLSYVYSQIKEMSKDDKITCIALAIRGDAIIVTKIKPVDDKNKEFEMLPKTFLIKWNDLPKEFILKYAGTEKKTADDKGNNKDSETNNTETTEDPKIAPAQTAPEEKAKEISKKSVPLTSRLVLQSIVRFVYENAMIKKLRIAQENQ